MTHGIHYCVPSFPVIAPTAPPDGPVSASAHGRIGKHTIALAGPISVLSAVARPAIQRTDHNAIVLRGAISLSALHGADHAHVHTLFDPEFYPTCGWSAGSFTGQLPGITRIALGATRRR